MAERCHDCRSKFEEILSLRRECQHRAEVIVELTAKLSEATDAIVTLRATGERYRKALEPCERFFPTLEIWKHYLKGYGIDPAELEQD